MTAITGTGGGNLPTLMPFGHEIDALAAQYVAAYDANGDGQVQAQGIGAETLRSELQGTIPQTRVWYEMQRLATMADLAGNGDGQASQAEIGAMMRMFDTGSTASNNATPTGVAIRGPYPIGGAAAGDGRLSGEELYRFQATLGEERAILAVAQSVTTTPGVQMPPPGPPVTTAPQSPPARPGAAARRAS